MVRRMLSCLMAVVVSATCVLAQSPAKEVVLIKAGRLINVRGGRVLTDQAILIEGDRIKEVGPTQTVTAHAPQNARVIDLSRSTVLPGLIDCHTHLTFEPSQMVYSALSISL